MLGTVLSCQLLLESLSYECISLLMYSKETPSVQKTEQALVAFVSVVSVQPLLFIMVNLLCSFMFYMTTRSFCFLLW